MPVHVCVTILTVSGLRFASDTSPARVNFALHTTYRQDRHLTMWRVSEQQTMTAAKMRGIHGNCKGQIWIWHLSNSIPPRQGHDSMIVIASSAAYALIHSAQSTTPTSLVALASLCNCVFHFIMSSWLAATPNSVIGIGKHK